MDLFAPEWRIVIATDLTLMSDSRLCLHRKWGSIGVLRRPIGITLFICFKNQVMENSKAFNLERYCIGALELVQHGAE